MGIRALVVGATMSLILTAAGSAPAADPDYSAWDSLLAKYYDPAKGMNYGALKAKDSATLEKLRVQLAKVDVAKLSRNEQLAYWINLYNVSVVRLATAGYPLKSIQDLSTDPIVRLNVFKKDSVLFGRGAMSLNDVENDKIRAGFKDPRIHFAINCAARSCPPIRGEAYRGGQLDAQLDEQARKFLNGKNGVRLGKKGDTLVIHTTKIMDWFGEDFDKWGGGVVPFIKKYVSPDKAKAIEQAAANRSTGEPIDLEFDDYNWDLNDAEGPP